MVNITDDQIVISLDHFTIEDIKNSALAILQAQYLQQEDHSISTEEQRGYYLLIEIVKAMELKGAD